MRTASFVIAASLVATASAYPAHPQWPGVVLQPGETLGKTMFGAEQRWISSDGEPVLFIHVIRADGKGVLRAVWRDGGKDASQDVLVHDFGKDEMLVIARDDGELGFQFHSYQSHPNHYLAVRAKWSNHHVTITKQQPFNGYQPTPSWLFDPDATGATAGWRALRRGALTGNNLNSFSGWFDDEPVTVTRDGVKTTLKGTELFASLPVDALPVLGNHGKCDAAGCCRGDGAALSAWPHVESVCFSSGEHPRVRAIEITGPH
jgi:hypothetical protein